jgi:hypothetical protein
LRARQAFANVGVVSVSPLVAFAGLVTIGLLAMRLPRVPWHHPPSLDAIVAAGSPLVLLGIVLGPGIDLLNGSALDALAPVTTICVGWIGAGLGARLERRSLRSMPRAVWLPAVVSASAALLVVALVAWALTRVIPSLAAAWTPRVPAILALAAVAAVAGPGAVAFVARTSGVPRRAARAFSLAATLQAAGGTLAITIPLALHRTTALAGRPVLGWLWWVVLAVASGAVTGAIFLMVARLLSPGAGLGFVLLAALALGAGLGYAAGVSPFVVCALATALVVNVSPQRHAVRRMLADGERLSYAILLVAIGALLVLPSVWILVAALLLAGVRVAAEWASVRYGRGPLRLIEVPPDSGLGTIAQGGAAIGLGVSFLLSYGAHGWAGGDAVLTTIVLGVGVTHLLAPMLMRRAAAPLATQPQSETPALPLTHAAAGDWPR